MDNDYRTPDDDIVTMFESCVFAPSAIGNQAAGGGKESDKAG